MSKVISFTALHYGVSYLASAIRSVIDHVDEVWIAYTPVGSYGHRTDIPCPETRDELYAVAEAAATWKLHWYEGEYTYEGQHRESVYEQCPDAEIIVVLDADEIWPSDLVAGAIGLAELNPHIREWRVPMIHYWRSFYRAVLHDPAYPTRVINTRATGGETQVPVGLYINHMGYAQPPAIVGYKQAVHGHRSEWRRDIDWFRERYLANAQQDCHPVGSIYWNPEPVNPMDYMPEWMMEHPLSRLAVIE